MRNLGALVLLTLLSCVPSAALAQQDASALSTVNETPASLVVWNRTLALFRTSMAGRNPRDRASAATARIEAALERMTPESIVASTVQIGDERLSIVTSGTEALFAVHERDLPQDSAATLDAAGALVAGRLQALVRERAAQRQWPALAQSIGLSVLATVLFGATWLAVVRIRHRVVHAIASAATRRIPHQAVVGVDPRSLVSAVMAWLVGVMSFAFVGAAAYLWLTFVLNRFAYSQPWGARLGEILIDTLSGLAAGFVHAIPGLIAIGAIVVVTRTISRAVGAWFRAVEIERLTVSWLDPLSARAARKLVVAGIWLFALTVAYPYVPGANTEAFKGVSVILGLMVSLGSAGVVGQVLSGFFILFNRSLRPGEVVQIGDVQGVVKDLGMTAIRVLGHGRKEVTIPNSVAVGTSITNLSRAEKSAVVLSTSVTVGYGVPWRQVRALLLLAAARTDDVLREPAPQVFEASLSNFYVEYELVAYASASAVRYVVMARLHEHILDVFNEHGVQIMTPAFEGQPDKAVVVPPSQWFAEPAAAPAGGLKEGSA